MFSKSLRISVIALLVASLVSASQAADNTNSVEKAWSRLAAGNAIAIMRHALAPGTGDPDNFVVEDCSTQRNLSEQGREQAQFIGDIFRRNGIKSARVLTSQWCRCKETALLLDIAPPIELPTLNSFFENRSTAEKQTTQLRKALKFWLQNDDRPTVLVTHQVNISALTNRYTGSGEILIITLEGDAVTVLASVPTLD